MKFLDSGLERNFLEREYASHRKALQVNAIFTLIVLIGFTFVDSALVPAEILGKYRFARWGVLIPLTLVTLVMSLVVTQARLWIDAVTGIILLFGLCWTWLLQWYSEVVLGYLALGVIQTFVGTFFLLGLPIHRSIPVVAAFSGVFVIYAIRSPVSKVGALTYAAGCLAIVIISAFGAYRSERASRRQFVAQALSQARNAERLAIEADRSRWLEVIADFLRHELKNAMTGVSTSLELAAREPLPPKAREIMWRGYERVGFMRRLLAQVSEATSLETALTSRELVPMDFSQLVCERIENLRHDAPAWTVDTHIVPGVRIRGDADSLVQMLDKLLDNALEHGDSRAPLRIELTCTHQDLRLSIVDRGDALSGDLENIFMPFVSGKKAQPAADGNLGLGLFVAQTIAAKHGGSIVASALRDPPGAAFTVQLPLFAPALIDATVPASTEY